MSLFEHHVKATMPPLIGKTLTIAVLIALCGSAIAVIYSKHEGRKLFVELQELSKQRDELNIDWGRLQLEQSSYAAHALIEERAGKELSLVRPTSSEMFLIGTDGDYRFVGMEPLPTELVQLARERELARQEVSE